MSGLINRSLDAGHFVTRVPGALVSAMNLAFDCDGPISEDQKWDERYIRIRLRGMNSIRTNTQSHEDRVRKSARELPIVHSNKNIEFNLNQTKLKRPAASLRRVLLNRRSVRVVAKTKCGFARCLQI
ncbi:MAG: hypothetical protein AB7N71_13965 [Phycisphaerae bacterium]